METQVRVTNRLNLPSPVVNAVTRNKRVRGDYDISVTELLKPMRIVVLERQHGDRIIQDAADLIWALVGQIGHKILEMGSSEELTEQRLMIEREGIKVSGQMDLVSNQTLIDFKFTSAWSLLNGVKEEWVQQLNLYALIARENGIEIKDAQIVAIYRDWSIIESKRSPDYPQEQVQVFNISLWGKEEQERFLLERINAYKQALIVLPFCNSSERWEKPTVYALMKTGAKRATKLYDTEEEAKANLKPGFEVVTRPGESMRCEYYCVLSKLGLCEQYKLSKAE